MNPAIDRSMLALRSLWGAVQEQAEAVAGAAQEHAQDAGAAAEAGHAEEWGAEAMLHHVVDSPVWDLEPIGTIRLDLIPMPVFNVGGLEIDLGITKHVLFLMIATGLTILTMFAAMRASRRLAQGEEAPGGILNALEAFYMYLRDDVVMANIGHGGERFVPLVITLFFFILYANFLGLVPFGAAATGNIMVTGALAFIALLVIETAGFIALGPVGYAKTVFFVPPGIPGWMKPIMLLIMAPVEFIAKFSKIMALAIRLFANMTAGHFVVLGLIGLILTYGSFTHPIGLVAIVGSLALGLFVMLLEVFIALVQAYIFAMLVAVFIGLIRHAH